MLSSLKKKNQSACDAGDTEDPGLIPGLGGSPGGGNGNPLQYSCLKNPMDRGACQATQSKGSQRVKHDCASSTHTQQRTYSNRREQILAICCWDGTTLTSYLRT